MTLLPSATQQQQQEYPERAAVTEARIVADSLLALVHLVKVGNHCRLPERLLVKLWVYCTLSIGIFILPTLGRSHSIHTLYTCLHYTRDFMGNLILNKGKALSFEHSGLVSAVPLSPEHCIPNLLWKTS